MSTTLNPPPVAQRQNPLQDPGFDPVEDPSVDLTELLVRFLAEWRTGLLVALVVAALGMAKTYSLKAQYVAQATILPQGGSSAAAGLAGLFSTRQPGDVYFGLLGSRSVANTIIDRLDLLKTFGTGSRETAQNILQASSTFTPAAGGIIVVAVRNTNAQLATDIANAYVDALGEQQDRMNASEAARQQKFFEGQLDRERQALADAEDALKREQQRSGIVALDTQTQIGLGTIAATRSQISGLEVQLSTLLESETEQNPQVKTLRAQIAALEGKERGLEAASGAGGAGAAPAAGRIPELNLEVAHRQREVAYHAGLVSSLASSYEAARLSGAQSSPQYEVVDRAVVPEGRSWPPRTEYLALAAGAGVLFGIFAILLRLLARRIRSNPEQVAHLRTIRQNFRLGRRRA